jgi:hypothetical protein
MSLDPTQLALTAFNFLLPHLDYLRGKLTDSALSESGKALVAVVKDKWLAKNEAAASAVEEVAKDPADTDNRDLLLTYLRKALKADPDLAAEVERLLPAAMAANQQMLNQSGDNNKGAVVSGQSNTITIS